MIYAREPSGSGVSSTGNDMSSAGDDITQGPSGSGVSSTDDTSSAGQTFCYCHGPEDGDMIACDDPDSTRVVSHHLFADEET